jgi:hypothetical protein
MSNINPYNIDGTYPVAGQDNDSQGFRDNFTNIRNNFSYAQSEIADLQGKAITTSALTGSSLTNNLSYNVLQNAQLFSPSYTVLNQSTLTGAVILDYSQGSVQKVQTSGSITISFSGWPTTAQLGRLILWVNITSAAHTLTVPTTLLGLSDVPGVNTSTGVITFDAIGNYMLEFLSIDAGTTIFINDLTRNHASLRDSNLYFNDAVTSTLFVGFGGTGTNATVLSTAIAADAGRNVLSGLGSINAVSVGNLAMANIKYATLDTGPLAGHTITSSRGNLQTGTFAGVKSNDLLGYYNTVAYTGNGTGSGTANSFSQTARIDMYATGANLAYGLGGNIAFWTAQDGAHGALGGDTGSGGQNAVVQAVGIENDQSTRIFGNLLMAASASATQSSYKPASSSAAGVPGQMAWDSTYLYICTSANTWKRITLSTF